MPPLPTILKAAQAIPPAYNQISQEILPNIPSSENSQIGLTYDASQTYSYLGCYNATTLADFTVTVAKIQFETEAERNVRVAYVAVGGGEKGIHEEVTTFSGSGIEGRRMMSCFEGCGRGSEMFVGLAMGDHRRCYCIPALKMSLAIEKECELQHHTIETYGLLSTRKPAALKIYAESMALQIWEQKKKEEELKKSDDARKIASGAVKTQKSWFTVLFMVVTAGMGAGILTF